MKQLLFFYSLAVVFTVSTAYAAKKSLAFRFNDNPHRHRR